MSIDVLGIKLAKNVFQLRGVDRKGNLVTKTGLCGNSYYRLGGIAPCAFAGEAYTGTFCWARQFEHIGHKVKIIAPQYVKLFVRQQMNDGNDAEAICTAARQPYIPLVPKKSLEQRDVQAIHRARQRLVNHRTAVVSQIRGLPLDRRIAFGKSIGRARRIIPETLVEMANALSAMASETIGELWDFLCNLDRRVVILDKRIEAIFKANQTCRRWVRIKGVGPKTATAIVAAVGEGAEFTNGRRLAAWLGLVPRQHSSGDRQVMMGISKRRDQHLVPTSALAGYLQSIETIIERQQSMPAEATMMASSSTESTVNLASFGPVGRAVTNSRFFHLRRPSG